MTADGIVEAISAGTAFITATSENSGVNAKCEILVKEKMGTVTGDATHISCRNAQLSGKVNLPQASSTNMSFGVLYSTSSDVLLNSAIQLEAKQFDAEYNFTVETGVLEPETIYYYRSFIIQNDEVKYGQIQSFTTLAVSSLIQTLDAGNINPKDATLNASLNLTDCRYESLEYGFEFAPEGGQTRTLISDNHADNSFSYQVDNLTYNTKYSYAAYVKLDDKVYKGEPKTFSTLKSQLPAGAVDLGLSVYWASCNLGASKPTEYGGYFQWAGTKDVSDTSIYLDWNNCPYHIGSNYSSGWSKYNTKSSYGTVDNNTVLEAKDDAASVALDGKWRIPTDAEWSELRNTDNCSWTWTTIDGVCGYKVQSKKSGYTDKWIFLPAAGYRYDDYLYDVGSSGDYWSSSLDTYYPYDACLLHFDSSYVNRGSTYRYYGQSVRPVSE